MLTSVTWWNPIAIKNTYMWYSDQSIKYYEFDNKQQDTIIDDIVQRAINGDKIVISCTSNKLALKLRSNLEDNKINCGFYNGDNHRDHNGKTMK